MKILVFSDIHGLPEGAERMEKAINRHDPDRIVLLGDLLHGGYNEGGSEVTAIIRKHSGKIIAVEGNCDYQSDSSDLNILLPHYFPMSYEGRVCHLSHRMQFVQFPNGDIVMYGHTHVKTLLNDDGVVYFNPGSISLPRDGVPSYGLMDGGTLSLHEGDTGSVLKTLGM